MPRRVSFVPSAQRQFNAQVAYLSDRNPAAAYRLLARVEAARQQLSDFPRSGPRGPVPSTRRLIVSPYVLTYREVDGDVQIVDFRHGRQRGLGEEDQTG
jgi:plasmid stabilization system protein ParE